MPVFSPDLIVLTVLIGFAGIQLFYYLFFFARLSSLKPPAASETAVDKPVTIIVCAFNEEANLLKNLPLLLDQDYHRNGKPWYEVLVVNHNSEDDTFYVLNRMKEQYPHLSVLHLTQDAKLIPGKKFPLSMGIKQARFEHLLLTDADCRPGSRNWLRLMASGFAGGKSVVLGYSPYTAYPGSLNRHIRFETAHTAMQYLSYALAGFPYMGVGRNLAYVRELFVRNKGFSSHNHILSGDDDLFINQVAHKGNTAVVLSEEAFTWSEPKRTPEEWRYQKSRHLSTGRYYRPLHRFLLGGYAFSQFMCWVALVAIALFPAYWPWALGVWLLRWSVQFLVFASCFRVLHARDLRWWIPFYDLWYLWYNIRHIPSVFFKKQRAWRSS